MLGEVEQAFRFELALRGDETTLGLPCIEAWAVRASDPTPGLPMPRFYFDMVEDGSTTHDDDGVEMPSAKLARRAATAIVTVIAYDRATKNLVPGLCGRHSRRKRYHRYRDERAQGRAAADGVSEFR